jgi:predicted permease
VRRPPLALLHVSKSPGQPWLGEALLTDTRYAIRQLRKSPAFTIAVVLTLALAISANTAIYSVVRAVLLQPLAYQQPEHLFAIWHGDGRSNPWYTFSYPRFLYFQEHLSGAAEIAAYDDETATFSDGGEPLRVEGGRVSANFFSLLGIRPALGRTFLPNEDHHEANPVVLLSDRFWRRRYNADPAIVGRTVVIDAEEFSVIGVLPRGFEFQGVPIDVWRSRIVDTRTFAPTSVQLGASYLTIIARLQPSVTLPQLRAELSALAAQYSRENSGNSDIVGPVSAELLQQKIFSTIHTTLLVLWGAVVCLLIVACANVANLVLARAAARYRDIRVRFALGATRRRIAQQLITENVLLSLCSAVLSLPLSAWATAGLALAFSRFSPSVPNVHLDFRVMLSTLCAAAAIGVVCGLAPMAILARATAHSQERGFSASKWSTQLRNAVVAGEVAICVILLAAAGLLTRSFLRMSTLRTGLRTDHILMVSLDLMPDRYAVWRKRVNFYDEVLRRVKTIPGIQGTAIASRMDLVGSGLGYMLQVEGSPDLGSRNPGARGRSVTPEYFPVLGIPLLRGRLFTEHDTAASSRVAIVNKAFARKFFPGIDPIGKHITYSTDRIICEIVGVVENVRSGVQDTGVEQELYLPLSQRPWLVAKLLVRTANPTGVAAAIRNRIQSVDPGQAVAESVSLERAIARQLGRPQTAMLIVVVFAGSALLLAAIGIYGVVACSVAQRQKEIGIRMALGADPRRVKAMVFRQTFRLLGIGAIIGLPLAILLNRLYASLLFDVPPHDPTTLACVIGVLFSVALAASHVPAVRAANVDPAIVLRAD